MSSEDAFPGHFVLRSYVADTPPENISYLSFLISNRETIKLLPPYTTWDDMQSTWANRFLKEIKHLEDSVIKKVKHELKGVQYLESYWSLLINERKQLSAKNMFDDGCLGLIEIAGKSQMRGIEALYTQAGPNEHQETSSSVKGKVNIQNVCVDQSTSNESIQEEQPPKKLKKRKVSGKKSIQEEQPPKKSKKRKEKSIREEQPLKKSKKRKVSGKKSESDDNKELSDEDETESIEINLEEISKKLEMTPLYEWKVENINISQRFRQYQSKVIDKVKNHGLTWRDTYEILALSSVIVFSYPCPYPEFTAREWDIIIRKKQFVIEPVIPRPVSATLQEAARKHLMDEDSYVYADNSELGRAAACTFNELRNVPPLAPPKMTEELHCCNLLYPHVNPIFNQPLKEYTVQLNRAVKGTKKRPDFSCLVDDIPILNSEVKPLGFTPLQKKKDFVKVHLRAKKALNQQLNLKGGPGESWLFTNMGDVVESYFMVLKYDLYCSWSFHTSKLTIDKPSMPLVESTFSHFAALEKHVGKLAEDFKNRKGTFTPPGQVQIMSEFPDSPQLRKLLE